MWRADMFDYFRFARHASSDFDFLDSHLIRAQLDLKIKEL